MLSDGLVTTVTEWKLFFKLAFSFYITTRIGFVPNVSKG